MTRLGICAFACAVFVQGCSGGGLSVNQVKDADVNAFCDKYIRCGVVTDRAFCEAALGREFNDANLLAGVANGSIGFDGKLAQECIDALDGSSCDPSTQDNRVQPQACKDAVKGNRHAGDVCYFNGQCSSNSCTIPTTSCGMACCAGTCDPDPPAPVAVGQPCSGTIKCVDGAFCDMTGTCAALVAIGGTCAGDNQCAYGSVCAGAPLACAATPKAGDACLMHGAVQTCIVLGLACDATQHCVGMLDKGATCDPTHNACKQGLYCDPTSMMCVDFAADGAACSATTPCEPPDHCLINGTAGTCTPPAPNGTACTSPRDCQSNNCDATTKQCADKIVCS
jgi:hypothetical protein